jgi:nitroreductase
VPLREQWLGAGAALGNLLNAAHQLGLGAIVLSGERCFDATLLAQLGIGDDEFLAGFVSLGQVVSQPPARTPPETAPLCSRWQPARSGRDTPAPSDGA